MINCRCYTVHTRVPYREFCSKECKLEYNNRDKWTEKVLRALVQGNKVRYPTSIFCPQINLDLLDMMNDLKEHYKEMFNIQFMREDNLGYWTIVVEEELECQI